jgi:aminopeptidase N
MIVTNVTKYGREISWKHVNNRLTLFFEEQAGNTDFLIEYNGIPADGLIISRNRFGDRTFFSDNWPDRARCYLPCIDHPYDKATVEFKIFAPDEYKVVANGRLVEESDLQGKVSVTRWSEGIPLATKVMAFGAAPFAVHSEGSVHNVPVWTWVFPENRSEGFSDFAVAVKPLEFFSDTIGEYPYEKLANVQSKTIFGGLENAGTVFYSERIVNGRGRAEHTIAHEIAHQWFGNSVTENDWYHVWLSEGFATYLTSMYYEYTRGKEAFRYDMNAEREQILKFYDKIKKPVIDTTITDLMDLLSTNSYEKGAWVLHMLRHETGDEAFIKGLQEYYRKFRDSNALTSDFCKVMEDVSGKKLEHFFYQWLYCPGQPELKISTQKGKKRGETEIVIEQKQENLFDFDLELLVKNPASERKIDVHVNERNTRLTISSVKDLEIVPDPDVNLLYKRVVN